MAGRLVGAGVVLEPLRISHAAALVDVLADPALYRFTGGQPPTFTELESRFARQSGGRSPDGRQTWLNWVVVEVDAHRPTGYVQATVEHEADPVAAELAWVIGTPWQGRGLATAATHAMADWLSGAGITLLVAHIGVGHVSSEAVARSLGMAPTEVVSDGEVRWSVSSDAP